MFQSMPSDLLEYVRQGKDRWSMASSRLLEHPLTHLLPMAAFSLRAILKSLKKRAMHPQNIKCILSYPLQEKAC